jgi:Uma2 family endonuclease
MQTAPKQHLSVQEYLDLERKADARSEYLDGEMFALAGGTRRHSRIKVELIRALAGRLSGTSCQVFDSDMRVKIEDTGLYTYPDVAVARGNLRFENEREDTLLNPKVIVEVLSDSSASWDRGEKFWHYRHLESLAEYVLVSQDVERVEHYIRQPDDTWILNTIEESKGLLRLKSVKCTLPLSEIFNNTGLPDAAKPAKHKRRGPTKK